MWSLPTGRTDGKVFYYIGTGAEFAVQWDIVQAQQEEFHGQFTGCILDAILDAMVRWLPQSKSNLSNLLP
jgi:hypothetical protein